MIRLEEKHSPPGVGDALPAQQRQRGHVLVGLGRSLQPRAQPRVQWGGVLWGSYGLPGECEMPRAALALPLRAKHLKAGGVGDRDHTDVAVSVRDVTT